MENRKYEDKIKKDETSQKYFNVLSRGPTHKFIKDVLKEIKKIRAKNILDVGCGTGYVTKRIAKINPNIIAVDTDKKRIELAKEYTQYKVDFRVIEPGILPFPDNSFDLVTCLEVLEHVSDYIGFIKELKRVSRKYVIITVPNEPYFRLANFFRGRHLKTLGNVPDHLNHFSKNSIVRILKKYFKIRKAKISAFFWTLVICET